MSGEKAVCSSPPQQLSSTWIVEVRGRAKDRRAQERSFGGKIVCRDVPRPAASLDTGVLTTDRDT